MDVVKVLPKACVAGLGPRTPSKGSSPWVTTFQLKHLETVACCHASSAVMAFGATSR